MRHPGNYIEIYVHIVFAVKKRKALIAPEWEEELFRYITGTVQNLGHKMIVINGMPDHIHFLIDMDPRMNVSEIVREVKRSSTDMIRKKKYTEVPFNWQKGFGAFTCGRGTLAYMIEYIERQKEHHRKTSFLEEFRKILDHNGVSYREEYLFKEPE
jgi:putative transposase